MTETPEIAVVAQGAMGPLKEKLRLLERGGFEARIVAPPDTKLNA